MTIPAPTTTTAAPIATFCHVFMRVGSFLLRRPACPHSKAITCRGKPGNHGIVSLLTTHTPLGGQMFRQEGHRARLDRDRSRQNGVPVPRERNCGSPPTSIARTLTIYFRNN